MTLADRLNRILEDKKISAYKIEQDIKIGRALIGKYLKGTEPSVSNILLLSEYLNTPLDYLISGKGKMYNEHEHAKQIEYSTEEKLNIASDSNPEYGKDEYREKYYKKLEEENELLKKALQMHEKTIEDKNDLIEMYKTGQIIVVGQNSPKGIHK